MRHLSRGAGFDTYPKRRAEWEAIATLLLDLLRGGVGFASGSECRASHGPISIARRPRRQSCSPDSAHHDDCANEPWRLESAEPHALSISFALDAKFGIAQIDRRITAADRRPHIHVELA
jgi:hypothetical protein